MWPDLTIRWIYNGRWFVGPPTLEERCQDMRAMTERGRPDHVYHPPSPDAAR